MLSASSSHAAKLRGRRAYTPRLDSYGWDEGSEAQRQADAIASAARREASAEERRAGHIRSWGEDERIRSWLAKVTALPSYVDTRQPMAAWPLPRVLEIGCGHGRWSVHASGDLTVVDAVSCCFRDIRALRRGHGYAALHRGTTHGVVCPDGVLQLGMVGVYDVAFSFDTFIHFDEWLARNYVASLVRLVRKGGLIGLHYGHKPSTWEIPLRSSGASWYRSNPWIGDFMSEHANVLDYIDYGVSIFTTWRMK